MSNEHSSIIEPLSCLSRLFDVPACGSLRSGPHIEAAPRALCDVVREDLAVLRSGTTSIEKCISATYVLRRLPRATGSGPDVASLSGFRWFCRQRAVLYTLSPIRCHAAFANTVVSIRPPFTPAYLIDADASLSRDVAFRLLQRVFKIRHTSTNTASAVLARRRGWPCSRCHARCAFNAARFFLFGCKEDSSSVRRSELRVIPRRSASRAEPESPRALLPRATLFKWARGTWETRRPKERSRESTRLAPWGPSLLALSSTFCHRRCVRDGMEARSRAGTRPHH